MSCNYHVKEALLRASAMKRVRELFRAKDLIRIYLERPVYVCSVCYQQICDHDECCEDYYLGYDYRFCPDCGERLTDDDPYDY